ncbi:hypothetical protein, partial [Desulfobulbus elongatus]|uniref:hypothetical protein n=1 Tax=Desulfobulbus elongatus TaxID=53332 RepID=UPI00054E9557
MTESANIEKRCDAIEECYEFMLAYAAQGITDDRESRHGGQLRELLARAVDAAAGLPEAYAAMVAALQPEAPQHYANFLDVLAADTARALAALELVLAQPRISSQLVDNLNASLHVRTLLTDVFLLDEILNLQQSP